MNTVQLRNAYYTIVRKETVRIFRIWGQTFIPSVITSLLYFTVFGKILGARVGEIMGFPYIQFVVPGLVMLSVITNAFTNTSTSFFSSKFMARNIDELLVSPTPPWVIIAGYVTGGMIRGIIVGLLVISVSLVYAVPPVTHPLIILLFLVLASLLFALGGLVNGIYGKTFDAISIVPTFVITPIVYLAGVFYSVQQLPPLFQQLTLLNPIFYIINGFRYGFLGVADVDISSSIIVLLTLIGVLIVYATYLVRNGLGLKQ
jgi:ABC-2 type transport system permease protein